MDYYRMRNIEADTSMRDSISDKDSKKVVQSLSMDDFVKIILSVLGVIYFILEFV
eukprot:UN14795